jgi:hypothetical protein
MSDTPTNHFSKKCEILADLWLNHRSDDEFQDFIEYNDIGLPLAYAFAEDLAKPTEIGIRFVDETYSLLCEALDLPDDIEWDSLETMLSEKEWSDEDKNGI